MNLALPREPLDSPALAEFVSLLEPVNELWWVPAGHVPSVDEARERLDHLRALGPSDRAFTFKRHFPAPGAGRRVHLIDARDLCPAG